MKTAFRWAAGIALSAFLPVADHAQFIQAGSIRFEKRINVNMMLQKDTYSWMKNYLQHSPKSIAAYYNYYFDSSAAAFLFDKNDDNTGIHQILGGVAKENRVYTYFGQDSVISLKTIFGEDYRLQNKLKPYRWKIMNEVREIAGYPCRKAITRICDSVVVVAFYTAQIPVSGGPESFNGLPGMILELAVPRLYTTWIADSVTAFKPEYREMMVPKGKGKVFKEEAFQKTLKDATSGWSKSYTATLFWWLNI